MSRCSVSIVIFEIFPMEIAAIMIEKISPAGPGQHAFRNKGITP
jgi:hypothetical protein